MESINPNDISNFLRDDISFITLKNGNKIIVDKSVPERYKNKNNTSNLLSNNKVLQKLGISNNSTLFFKGLVKNNNLNFRTFNSRYNNINNQKILKNDFNLISSISNKMNFSFKPNLNNNLINNKYNHLLNNKLKKDELKEEEKIDKLSKGKSRNNLDIKINSLLEEKSWQKTTPIITFNIISDLNKHLNLTQKTFNSLFTQLKQKKNKYSSKKEDRSLFHKYYELYKNKEDTAIKQFIRNNFNKIKHYEVPKQEEARKNDDIFDRNKFNKNFFNESRNLNTIYIGMNDSDINNKTSINSFHSNRIRPLSEKKILNYKLGGGNLGYSSTLICPSNLFKDKSEKIF